MILDERLEFCDAVALNTGAAGSYLLGDVIDLQLAAGGDIGAGEPLYLIITVDTTATSDGSATAEFKLASDAQAAIATDGSATVHASTGPIPVANLTAGRRAFVIPLPSEGLAYERYLGILQTTAVAAFTAGKINAFITLDPTGWKAYADAPN
jgi:hypothetical protein